MVRKSKKTRRKKAKTWKETNPGKRVIGDVKDPHVLNSLLDLVAAVIKGGLKEEGIRYLENESTLNWLKICNLDSDFVLKKMQGNSLISNKFIKI